MTTANERPDWPGSKWLKFDLHAHTPASYDFGGDDKDFERWLTAARDEGLDAVAVTDHNSAEAIDGVKEAASRVENAPVIFPGVELTASDGSHLILIMDPSAGRDHVQDLLSRAGIGVSERGKRESLSSLDVNQILDKFGEDAVIIAAHVNVSKVGILANLRGRQRLNVLRHPNLAAAEINPDEGLGSLSEEDVQPWLNGSKAEVGRKIPQIYSSDSHDANDIGKRFTWIKMTEPNLEGLRLALMDGETSLATAKSRGGRNPNSERASTLIESVTARDAKYIGRGDALPIRFNPWLNAIIGGRGTGKSTLVDFCRKTLRRDGKLDGVDGEEVGALRTQFDNRMSTDGLLENKTVLEMVYVKDGRRFLLAWSQDGSAASISLLDGDSKITEDGNIDISERFPARIYSQKQLFALGRNTSSLLQEIDDAPEVGASEVKGRIIQLGENYLALRAAARSARSRASDLPSREAELRDARRKLDVMQNESGARALNDYRIRRQANDDWGLILSKAEDILNSERERLDNIITPDLNWNGVDDPAAALARARQSLASAMAYLRQSIADSIDEAETRIRQIRTGADVAAWRASVEASRAEYEAALLVLQDAGVSDLSEYDDIMTQVANLESEIRALEAEGKKAEELESEAKRTLDERRREIRDLSRRRRAFAAKTSGESVRVQVNELADSENLPKAIGDILGTDSFEKDRDAIADNIRFLNGGEWDWQNLDRMVSQMRLFISGGVKSWDSKDRRFETALKRAEPERIDRLALYAPRDGVDVSFRDAGRVGGWRSLSQGSPGQQTAALLAFVLGFGSEPIILDQPEDDLDSALIYDLLVKRFKEKKRQRQVIVITHNPNIVVHGDAEMVVSLDFHRGRTVIKRQGGIQQTEVRDEICRVMEGGREAFRDRYRRIMPKGETAT